MTVEVFPSKKSTPQQTFLEVEDTVSDMRHVAIVYMMKDELNPRLTCSSMSPCDLNFLGAALQHYSLKFLKE